MLHGTTGSGKQMLAPSFANYLFGAGQPLDAARYFIILPDEIGHGASSKPSDGLHARFPHYDYDDMVNSIHELVTSKLGVNPLRLVLGVSMGGMQTWMWGEKYPDLTDALMPLASNPVQIGGINRIWRKEIIDAIRNDPDWQGGEYKTEPVKALTTIADITLLAPKSAPIYDGREWLTVEEAARRRGCSIARIHQLARRGVLRHRPDHFGSIEVENCIVAGVHMRTHAGRSVHSPRLDLRADPPSIPPALLDRRPAGREQRRCWCFGTKHSQPAPLSVRLRGRPDG